MPFTVVLLMILLIPVYCSLMIILGFIVVTDVIFREYLYNMFYVVELSASEHLFEISAI